MLEEVIGDTAGSPFELNPDKHTDFELMGADVGFTDDTVCTVAIADWVNKGCPDNLTAILQR
ncbi:hypothetical protein [Neisseria iguanae]|uniref:hypothetical protein n=1 Tax=Neisseria iguanae TaxID=90242 RepID=UPI001FE2A399|nr:hypothetical protein [Neisseria iguanae]